MSKTKRVLLADLGFAIAIPDGWHRITHSMWGPAFPAMHYNTAQDDREQADYELTCSRQAARRQSSQAAAAAIETELSQAYSKFAYADTTLGGREPRAVCVVENDRPVRQDVSEDLPLVRDFASLTSLPARLRQPRPTAAARRPGGRIRFGGDIGCAEGYYAVGMAGRMPATRVDAFDIDPAAQRACGELAARRGVAERVRVGARFTADDFAAYAGRKTLVLCDVEGA